MKRHLLALLSLAAGSAFFMLVLVTMLDNIQLSRHERVLGAFQKSLMLATLLENNVAPLTTVSLADQHLALMSEEVAVTDSFNVIIVASEPAIQGKKLEQLSCPLYYDMTIPPITARCAYYVTPYQRNGQALGYVLVKQNFQNSMLADYNQKLVVLAVLLLFGFVVFASWSIRRIIFKPISRLQKVVSECGLSDPLLNPAANVNNELTLLGRSIGQMNCQLKEDRDFQKAQFEKLQATQQEVEQTKKALTSAERVALAGRLASSVAHDVGNPLGVIQGYLTMLDSLSPDEQQQVVAKMQKELDRITASIHSLLDVSRPIVLDKKSVNINNWLQEIIARVGKMNRLSQTEISFATELPSQYSFAIDQERLTAVIENLLLNAADAMADNGPERARLIQITAKTTSNSLIINISDHGPGIKPELREQVFEPFYSTKPSQRGTGLGLYTAKQIIELHNGKIMLSETEESGLNVAVILFE